MRRDLIVQNSNCLSNLFDAKGLEDYFVVFDTKKCPTVVCLRKTYVMLQTAKEPFVAFVGNQETGVGSFVEFKCCQFLVGGHYLC